MKIFPTLLCLMLIGANARSAELKNPPATVPRPMKESELGTIILTPEAEKRLGIETAPMERRKVERARVFGGEVIMPPQTGSTNGGTNSQSVFAILPALSATELIRIAEAQIDADSQIERAKVQFEAATVTQLRAQKLVQSRKKPAAPVLSMTPKRKLLSLILQ